MLITVIVPTYCRPKDLARCLEALQQQTRPADEVLVIVRDTDSQTWSLLAAFPSERLPLQTVTVSVPGVVAALNLGLENAKGDIIAITDDDAAPHADWLARIEAHFLWDDRIGGVGGRDWIYQSKGLIESERNIRPLAPLKFSSILLPFGGAVWRSVFASLKAPSSCLLPFLSRISEFRKRSIVGRVQWFGRVIGNHHLGTGETREVDVLKGVNMSFRGKAIAGRRFDERLRGTGAQIHNEMAFCLPLKQAGWKLLYDPKIAVNHYPAQRFDEDRRDQFNKIAWANIDHNETVALLEYLPPWRRVVFVVWALLIGTRKAQGLLQLIRFLPKEGSLAPQKWLASLQGRWEGWLTWQHKH